MRILVLAADTRSIGGIQQYNKKFIEGLRSAGVEVLVVELGGQQPWHKLWFAASFVWQVIFSRPQFVACTHLNFSPLALFAKTIFGRDYSITVYGIEAADIRSSVKRRALVKAACVIRLFAKTEADVVRQVPETRGKFVHVPNSVDGERFFITNASEALLHTHGLAGAKVILTIARLSPTDAEGKGYERVMRAMPLVLAEVPEAKYLLVGGGEDEGRIRQVARDLGIEEAVRLVGPVADEALLEYYNLADVFAMPSKNEGFPPIVFLEALACGIPVVGGAQDGSEDPFWRDAALIVPPDDVSKIAAAITDVLTGRTPPQLKNRQGLRSAVLRRYGREGYNQFLQTFLAHIRNEEQSAS